MATVGGRLAGCIAEQDHETSPARIVRTGTAALYVDRLPHYRNPLWRAVQHGREGGAVTSAIEALLLLSADGWLTGTWDDVLATSAEASALCQEHGYPLLAGMSLSYQALVAAARGEHDKTRALASQLASWGGPRRALILTQRACHARALDAAGRGDFETAYENAATVAPPGTLDYTPQGLWVLFDLARVHLTYGERLRRDRATSDARRHLSAAREIERSTSRSRPAPGPGHANPATARDRDTRGSWPHEQADRRAAVPVAPHRRHTPVPDLPQTRRHFEGSTTRRIVQQRRSRRRTDSADAPTGMVRNAALGPGCCTLHELLCASSERFCSARSA